jgi:hypothetical protein
MNPSGSGQKGIRYGQRLRCIEVNIHQIAADFSQKNSNIVTVSEIAYSGAW